MTYDFSAKASCSPSATLTSCPRRAGQTQKASLSKFVSAWAVPLVFHSWSHILLNVGWRCVWLLLLMTKEKQLFHAMQCNYRNCHGTKHTVKSNDLAVSKSAIIFWKICDGRAILILTFFRNHYFACSQVLPLGALVSCGHNYNLDLALL